MFLITQTAGYICLQEMDMNAFKCIEECSFCNTRKLLKESVIIDSEIKLHYN